MQFTSLSFFLFFIIFYILFWAIKGKSRLYLIAISSFLFYAAWSPGFAFHFLFMVVLNYFFLALQLEKKNRLYLWIINSINLLNLFFFKYFYLGLEFLMDATGNELFQREIFNQWLYDQSGFPLITLPLAISFYTFQLMAYQVDVKRGIITEKPGLLNFTVFILFFPQLVAGPIMRHSDFFHQLDNIVPDKKKITDGLWLIQSGLVKKVIIADNLIAPIQQVFTNPSFYSWSTILLAAFGFAARVYADFSGYTDIARGLGKLTGLELPENFKGPFLSRSMTELWRRWHITLSTWLRDYIYIPLGGSRSGEYRSYLNLIITFTLGGLWHGAKYTFVVWGFLNGILLVTETIIIKYISRSGNSALNRFWQKAARYFFITGPVYTFLMFAVGIFFFNSHDIMNSFLMINRLFTLQPGASHPMQDMLAWSVVIILFLNWLEYSERSYRIAEKHEYTLITASMFVITVLIGKFAVGGNEFIYFQF